MQQTAVVSPSGNDIGLMNAIKMPEFQKYLESAGHEVRTGGAGQFCHVRLRESARWLPIERGRGGAPVTPLALREEVNSFLHAQRSMLSGVLATEIAQRSGSRGKASPSAPAANDPPPKSLVVSSNGETRAPIDDAQYLSDLRDDFAVHAPNLDRFSQTGDMADLVRLRWEYADLMMAARSNTSGD